MRNKLRAMAAIGALVAMAGCADPRRQPTEEAIARCKQAWPARVGNYEMRALCAGAALDVHYRGDPVAQLLKLASLSLGKDVDDGKISPEEAEFRLHKLSFDLANTTAQTRAAELSANILLLAR